MKQLEILGTISKQFYAKYIYTQYKILYLWFAALINPGYVSNHLLQLEWRVTSKRAHWLDDWIL